MWFSGSSCRSTVFSLRERPVWWGHLSCPSCVTVLPAVSLLFDSLWIIPLCSLSLCQFNHFSHFKMTIPQYYRSSCLSLPVSTPTAPPMPPFANVWPLIYMLWDMDFHSCMEYVFNVSNMSHLTAEFKRLHPSLSPPPADFHVWVFLIA